MGITSLSKYFIVFLFAVLVIISVLFAMTITENKALNKANAVLQKEIVLKNAVINDTDKNITELKKQVSEAESICEERIKARNDVLLLLKNKDSPELLQPAASKNIEQAKNNNGVTAAPLLTGGIVDDEESIFIIDSINSYWMQFAQPGDSKE